MFLKNIDFLTPDITLYYKGSKKHSSIVSGILTVIHYSCIFAAAVYYLSALSMKSTKTFFYFKEYVEDPGSFDISPTELFHYVTFNGQIYDPQAMSLIGVQVDPDSILYDNSEDKIDYWRYSKCNWNIQAPNEFKKSLENKEGLCISEFYNHTLKKTFKINEPEFAYPKLEHGIGSTDAVFYGIVLQGCQNNTKPEKDCYEKEESKKKISQITTFNIYITDHYINVENYTHPLKKYLQRTEAGVFEESIIVNNLHFSPTEVKTHTGFWFTSIKKKRTYTIDQSVKGSYTIKDKTIGGMAYFWMHNNVSYYERTYLTIPDILSSIAGIGNFTYTIFFCLNLIYSRFIIISDFNHILLSTINQFKKEEKMSLVFGRTMKKLKLPNKKRVQTVIFESKTLKKKNSIFFFHTLSHFFKVKSNCYITNLENFRKKILGEEKILIDEFIFDKLLKVSFENKKKENGSNSLFSNHMKLFFSENNLIKFNNITNSNVEFINEG